MVSPLGAVAKPAANFTNGREFFSFPIREN